MTVPHDEFAAMAERHRRELRVHCYRMLGSFDEAEDMVQETFLRAWKAIDGFEGRSSVRAWLYRIATNACLDFLDGTARRALPQDLRPPSDATEGLPPRTDIPWLQPFPDRLAPEETAVERETIELAFLAAIQHLPPRQRAALLLRDVLGWRPGEIADVLEGSVVSVNSALQRARVTLREHLPARRADWAPSTPPTAEERAVLHRYMAAMESADPDSLAALLAEDVRTAMPPWPMWFRGRGTVLAALRASWASDGLGYRFRMLPTRANGRPAVATYVRTGAEYRAFAISVLRIERGLVTDVTAFHDTHLFPAFDLPPFLPADDVPRAAPSP
ncbi:sigma-70 family RNA polymerase sigma factor [Pseudonocardia sp. DSM 110487]|uniref:sigma-70 family RNA polymerase sigma factor n=1 Tax=Pseudonocardia sp. DSM 110487 TaxID=2865833 RepID=UPI001C69DC32|nr:sigma-70 family RNA polymerase sigma factor [Pseudonocardia sp. DSM 110487]QYN38559.1 sigma-70 family RNA polymerase sigma factor [Pseudonocardia sp. DSM 110487]